MISFAKWRPDVYDVNANVAGVANGVLPGPNAYLPWPLPVVFSNALATACVGAVAVRDTSGNYTIFAGTKTGLYKYAGVGVAWTDVTRLAGGAYNVPDDERWSFAQFGDLLLASNANDVLQVITITGGTNFAAVSGSPPQARVVRIVGDIVMLAGLTDNPDRVRWSGRNDSAYWTAGSRDSDLQDFKDGGFVNGISTFQGGNGLIFQESVIRRFVPVNSRSIFEFARVEDNRGLIAPDSLVTLGGVAYYLSEDGFYATNVAGESKAIGADAIDKWFQTNVNYDRIYAVQGAADPVRQRIFWLFPSSSNIDTVLDYCVCYDIALNQWTWAEISASHIFAAATGGYTIDSIDTLLTSLGYTLETAPFSFDARFLQGGAPYLAMFDSAFKLNFFSGANMASTVETGDFQPVPGQRSFMRGVRIIGGSTSATATVGVKERPQGSVTFGSAVAQNSQGISPQRASGLYHRIRVSEAASTTWSFLQGVDPDVVPEGQR